MLPFGQLHIVRAVWSGLCLSSCVCQHKNRKEIGHFGKILSLAAVFELKQCKYPFGYLEGKN